MDFTLQLSELNIELTRDCNLNCPHCMRYEPNEPMDAYRGSVISKEIIDALFERYRHIDLIVITGGEPMLHPEMITYLVDKIIEKQVYIEQIQIITNGTIASEEAVTALNRAYNYIIENCVNWANAVVLGVSERFHDNKISKQKVYDFYKEHCLFPVEYASPKISTGGKFALAYAGRAKALPDTTVRYYNPVNHKICISPEKKVLCQIDLSISGNFVTHGQCSFQDADRPENIICSVNDDLLLALVHWNYEHPLNCKEAQYVSDCQQYFDGKAGWATDDDLKDAKLGIEHYSSLNSNRKEIHKQFPALYPDDIENLSDLTQEKSKLYCQMHAALLNNKRSKETCTDASCWCTCPPR